MIAEMMPNLTELCHLKCGKVSLSSSFNQMLDKHYVTICLYVSELRSENSRLTDGFWKRITSWKIALQMICYGPKCNLQLQIYDRAYCHSQPMHCQVLYAWELDIFGSKRIPGMARLCSTLEYPLIALLQLLIIAGHCTLVFYAERLGIPCNFC